MATEADLLRATNQYAIWVMAPDGTKAFLTYSASLVDAEGNDSLDRDMWRGIKKAIKNERSRRAITKEDA